MHDQCSTGRIFHVKMGRGKLELLEPVSGTIRLEYNSVLNEKAHTDQVDYPTGMPRGYIQRKSGLMADLGFTRY